MKVNLEGCKEFIKDGEYSHFLERANKALEALKKRDSKGSDFLGWMDLPQLMTKDKLLEIQEAADAIKENSDVLIVIGIGGSYLGARSAIEAINGYKKGKTEVIFAGNNISGSYHEYILDYIKDKDFSLNVISKSGTTTEPAIAFRILKAELEKRYNEKAKDRIYVTTDKDTGVLRQMANKEGYKSFVIPSDVGGRYSVLSACGLLPIAVADIDIFQIIEGAKKAQADNEKQALEYAAIRNLLYENNRVIEIMVAYDPTLQYFCEWWKQLYGESEGKENKGIYPSSVINTTDLHSLGQYVQEGIRNLFETVLYVKDDGSTIKVPFDEEDKDGLNYIADSTLQYVNSKAMEGTMLAHLSGQVPNIIIEIDKMDAFNYGMLVYFFEIACGISGYILGVNPFDQPGVEAYKKSMFKLLGKPGF